MCWSRTLKLHQPADSHWLDNVSPLLPPTLASCAPSLFLSRHQSRFSFHSLSHPQTLPPPCFYFASVSSLRARPRECNGSTRPCPAPVSVYPSARLHPEPLPFKAYRGNLDRCNLQRVTSNRCNFLMIK